MESNTIMDWIVGGVACSILLGGLWMLFSGIRQIKDK